MAGVLNKPEALNLSGNMNQFLLSSTGLISFILKKGNQTLLEQSYEPGPDHQVRIDLKDVIEGQLSYNLDAGSLLYVQPNLAETFTAVIDGAEYSFRVVRGGVANLADTASNWLKLHFLTWQPRVKSVTYYSPEWLTYYAVEECTAKLKATYPNKSTKVITLGTCVAGHATTMNLQYSVVVGKLGNTYPSYYEVWTEKSGTKLSESQIYAFSDPISEDEQWYLFENSLGGLDTFRAAGTNNLNAEHEHNIATLGNVREEYQVDTERKYVKNTGYLDEYSRHWLLDFFPSKTKFVYEATAIRKIVVTESNVTYVSNELPSSYTFTWQMAEVSSFLNLVKNSNDIPDHLVAPDLSSPDFILPPRLVEYPRVTLSEGVLIPAFDPFNQKPTVTTYGIIHNTIKNAVVKELENEIGSLGGGGGDCNFEIIESFQLGIIYPTDKNIYSALSTEIRIAEEFNDFLVDIDEMYLRKDIDDRAHGVITFDKKIGSTIFLAGYDGKGWEITEIGVGLFDSARVRSDIFIGGKFGSPSFASGFAGWGVEIDIPTAAGTFDFLTVRKSMKVYELVYSQIYGLGGSVIVSDLNKILYVETCQGFYRCYMDSMDGTMRMNLRKDDIVRMQRSQGVNIRYFYGEVLTVTPDYFDLKIIDGEDYPQFGDVVFRFGNKSDKNRQGIIYLTSSDDNAPYIDVLDGITDMSMFEKVKVRLGNYSGIRTKKGVQLKGYGIYAQGGVFEDTDIYLQDGTTVEQQFIIMNGKFESTIEGIKNDMSLESGNILRNSSFGSNTNYWSLTNNVHFINVGGSFLWMDGAFYTEKTAVADIYKDGNKNVLRVLGTTISQSNTLFKGEKAEGTYSFAFYYKVLRPGTLSVGFTGKDLFVSEALTISDGYQKLSKVAQWDGSGDFSIGFTGEILIYGVSLFNDALADAQIKLQTQIDQTAEYIKLLAKKEYVDAETGAIYTKYDASLTVMAEEIAARVTRQDFNTETGVLRQEITSGLSIQAGRIEAVSTKVDNVQKTIDTAGWINTTQGNTLFAAKTLENGQNIISYINQTPGNTTIASNRINLYGAVSFSMLSDYTTINSRINGKADSSSLGDLAYQNYVYSRDLAKEITDTISAKVSPGQLRNYAFANGASITKGDLISALQTEITGKLTGTATSSGNKLASVIVNGQTLIAGGYIQANLINADEIWCTSLAAIRGKVAAFNISGNSLSATVSGETLTLSPSGVAFSKSGIYCGFGPSSAPSILGLDVPAWVYLHKSQDINYGMVFDIDGALSQFNNIAISLVNGCIAGLKVKTKQISSTYTALSSDVLISCYNKSDITLYLPSSPKFGEVKYVRRNNNANIAITATGGKKIMKGQGDLMSSTWTGGGAGDMVILFYDGQYWLYNYMGR